MKLKKIKRIKYYLLSFLLVFFLVVFYFNFYSVYLESIVENISNKQLEKDIYLLINDSVSNVIKNENVDNFFIMNTNSDNEILYIDYDLKKSYYVLEKMTFSLKNKLIKKSVVLFLPIGLSSKNIFLYNLGPKVAVKINYADSLITNVYTKVTNYGLNNALLEIYIKVKLNGLIIAQFKNTQKNIEYDVLIASKVVSGKVPMFYGDSIKSSSMLFDISIN